MAKKICPRCHESVDTSDPLTVHSLHTDNYYHVHCEPYVWHMPRTRAWLDEQLRLRDECRQEELRFTTSYYGNVSRPGDCLDHVKGNACPGRGPACLNLKRGWSCPHLRGFEVEIVEKASKPRKQAAACRPPITETLQERIVVMVTAGIDNYQDLAVALDSNKASLKPAIRQLIVAGRLAWRPGAYGRLMLVEHSIEDVPEPGEDPGQRAQEVPAPAGAWRKPLTGSGNVAHFVQPGHDEAICGARPAEWYPDGYESDPARDKCCKRCQKLLEHPAGYEMKEPVVVAVSNGQAAAPGCRVCAEVSSDGEHSIGHCVVCNKSVLRGWQVQGLDKDYPWGSVLVGDCCIDTAIVDTLELQGAEFLGECVSIDQKPKPGKPFYAKLYFRTLDRKGFYQHIRLPSRPDVDSVIEVKDHNRPAVPGTMMKLKVLDIKGHESNMKVLGELVHSEPEPAKAKKKPKDKNVCCECGGPAVVMQTGEGWVKYYCDNCVQGKPNSIGGTVGGVYYCPYCGIKMNDGRQALARHVVQEHPTTNGSPPPEKDWRLYHYCPFCREPVESEGMRDHVLARHPGAMLAFEEKFNRDGITYHLGYFCRLVAGNGVTAEPVKAPATDGPRQLVQADLSRWVSA